MLVIGATYADIKGFSLGAYNPEGRNVGTVQVVAGGVCRNVAEDLAKLGMEVDFVSLVDETSLGERIKNELKLHDLKMDHVFSLQQQKKTRRKPARQRQTRVPRLWMRASGSGRGTACSHVSD